MKKITILLLMLGLYSCSAAKNDKMPVQDTAGKQQPYMNITEGFTSPHIFQVVVASTEKQLSAATSEAETIGKQRSFNLMINQTGITSTEGRKKVQGLVNSYGRIAESSESHAGKFYFIYQVEKKGLKILLNKEK